LAISSAAKAGLVLFFGTVQFGILLIVAEALLPTYSDSVNYISDLGATSPASMIFNPSIILFGLLVMVAAYYLNRAFRWMPLTCLIVISGIGLIGVGVFPEPFPFDLHGVFSVLAYLFIGLSAVVAARFQKKPLFYFSIVLGLITLVALVLYGAGIYLGLGPGGMERMIAYPALFWLFGFGGHLMAFEDNKPQ